MLHKQHCEFAYEDLKPGLKIEDFHCLGSNPSSGVFDFITKEMSIWSNKFMHHTF